MEIVSRSGVWAWTWGFGQGLGLCWVGLGLGIALGPGLGWWKTETGAHFKAKRVRICVRVGE